MQKSITESYLLCICNGSDTQSNPVQSNNFTIDTQTGDIFPTNEVQTGAHSLVVQAYNQSDASVTDEVSVSRFSHFKFSDGRNGNVAFQLGYPICFTLTTTVQENKPRTKSLYLLE